MNKPIIECGKFHAGADLQCGENVVIDVAEEVVVGDRCVLPDNAYFGGRSVAIGNDFYGYSWEWRRLDIGRGRYNEERAVLSVGDRCTFHDNMIDLAYPVAIGNDVGLSPQVSIYTHGYWGSCLDGYPYNYSGVSIGNMVLVGYRSVLLPGTFIQHSVVVGAQSVVTGTLRSQAVYGGSPARAISQIIPLPLAQKITKLEAIVEGWQRSLQYRGFVALAVFIDFPILSLAGYKIDVETMTGEGDENITTDDLRWYLFKHGIRVYTKRPFKSLGKS